MKSKEKGKDFVLIDEIITNACKEYSAALISYVEKLCSSTQPHKFSQKFCKKMHEICPSIDPDTGKVHSIAR